MSKEIAVVFDCGATNVRAIAVDRTGKILASAGFPNKPVPQKNGKPGWLIWDIEEIWKKLCFASRKICAQVSRKNIKSVTVTTFGADGAPVDKNGNLTYPVISWQCPRTADCSGVIYRTISAEKIYKITGYQVISFNTILKLMWLQKNAQNSLKKAKYWLMMPGLLSYKLCGEFSIDPTIGSTMMAMNIKKRNWSKEMLGMADLKSSFFPEWTQPGEIIGKVTERASKETGLPEGIPVIACGHDTQFALYGCGARKNEAVLSTGTWEILMVRTNKCTPDKSGFEGGLIFECDATPGYWNPQILMMGSGVLEWVRKNFFSDVADKKNIYSLMMSEGRKIMPGSDGVTVIPSFKLDTGPFRKFNVPGTILGLTLGTNRSKIYRGALEGLAFQLKSAMEILKKTMNEKPKALRVVGGGSKNDLWNQIRADVCNMPVVVTEQKEATVLGAAIFAFAGSGVYKSVEEARKKFEFVEHIFKPSGNKRIYRQLFEKFKKLPQLLKI
ncbi:L-fuculokinase [Candidatus Desantisbacteria bacterium CG1_02_38_46]|uniref:L-fuculokinase n=3 Tax=unclassified Candidatus Desantisiibacteriota TaxID=3106372 RepID=A0A2H9PC07_9BACT|nr:MAG: L-fuculokinase [Candidatus Desantisbacteria bacterium CG1_02_38_46]PIU50814.1 MAG: L-fuculokinase [Candidatus Desantisbacteria bacterium CG07_land_8_20_14_0_80_39_15]PIZ15646.1 MAG: L-fuculokinase [Candidatus Desantisbacteria bacterium CG_4_10_14_0_8_um_filter_39_17]